MTNGFSPLLIATPRSGSSLVGHYLSLIGQQTANYQNNLYEYFDTAPWNNARYGVFKLFGKNIIGLATQEKILSLADNSGDFYSTNEYKFMLLKNNDYKYMIKIFPYNFDQEIAAWCSKNYNFVYLQRRDKLKQLLSYMAMRHHKITHYEANSSYLIGPFKFDFDIFKIFNKIYLDYKTFKSTYQGIELFYEDICQPSFNLDRLISSCVPDVSKIDKSKISDFGLRPSKYLDSDLENLIINQKEYHDQKSYIQDIISNWE